MFRRLALSLALPASALALVPIPTAAAAGSARPDLTAAKVAVDRTAVAQGGVLKVTHAVANRGGASAGSSVSRFYLVADVAASAAARKASTTDPRTSPYDLLLSGSRAVPAVRKRSTSATATVRATVPVATPPGTYRLLACADERGSVREANEADNCTAAPKPVTVSAVAGSDTLRLQQFADLYRWPTDESGTLQQIKPFCSVVQPARSFGLDAAITSARSFLGSRAGAGAVTQVQRSSLARTPAKAQELAAAAVTQGSPGLALAALLRAHELEPRNGTLLVDAAALASSVGLPNEALAFLDAAATGDFKQAAMGVSQQAIALVVRGNALVLTGRPDAARTAYLAAQQREPLLTEADAGLATIAACSGQDAAAQRFLRRSRQRTETPRTDPSGPVPAVDTSRGRATPLRHVPLADSPQQLVRLKPVYDGISDGFVAEIDGHNAEEDRLAAQLRAADEDRGRAEIKRRDGLLRRVHLAVDEPDIQALQDAYFDALLDAQKVKEGFFGEGTGEGTWTYQQIADVYWQPCEGVTPSAAHQACLDYEFNRLCRPAMISAHQDWRAKMSTAQQAGDAYFAALSRRMSGYAANLADPVAYRSAVLSVEESERAVYAGLVQQAGFWATNVNRVKDDCVEPKDAPALPAPGVPAAASEGPCTKGLRAFDIVVPIEPVTIKVNCEKVQVGIAGGDFLPLLTAFAEVTYDFRAGKVTFFGGAQGSGKVVGVAELAFKSGIYVTADRTGTVDAGWRVGPSAAVGTGSIESGVYNEEIDLSFVNALRGTD